MGSVRRVKAIPAMRLHSTHVPIAGSTLRAHFGHTVMVRVVRRSFIKAFATIYGVELTIDGTHANANVLPSPSSTQPEASIQFNSAGLVVIR